MNKLPIGDSRRARAWRRMALHAVLTLGVLTAGTAEAWTLDALLQLPLERLMELRVTAQRTAQEAWKPEFHADAGRNAGDDRAA